MGKAIEHVFVDVKHGLCTFHIMQNAVKHLCSHKDDDKNEEESSLLADLNVYEYDDKSPFEEAFCTMRGKVQSKLGLIVFIR
jgi:zinc finger SWIM domain-containing protein 3